MADIIINIQTLLSEYQISEYLQSFVIFLALILFFSWIKQRILNEHKEKAQRSNNFASRLALELLKQIKFPLLLIFAGYFGIMALPVTIALKLKGIAYIAFQGAIALQVLLVINSLVSITIPEWTKRYGNKRKDAQAVNYYLEKLIIIFVWVVGILSFLSNVGYNVTSLIASLGIGGVALALAVQDLLKDIISAFIILITQPFMIGDYVKIGDGQEGKVERIGIKNTVIRKVDGAELIVTNNTILNAKIENFRSREKRRVNFKLHLPQETKSTQIKKMKELIKEIITNEEHVEKEKIKVTFESFDKDVIVLNVLYHMNNNNFTDFVETKESINFKIKELCEKNKVNFAHVLNIS